MAAWSYLSVAGQAASSTIASSKVSSQNANSTRNLADMRAAAEGKEVCVCVCVCVCMFECVFLCVCVFMSVNKCFFMLTSVFLC